MCATLIYVKQPKLNVTLSLPAALMRDVKVRAAERNMSINAWIQQELDRAVHFGDRYMAAGEKILEASGKGLLKMPKRKWNRSDLYDV